MPTLWNSDSLGPLLMCDWMRFDIESVAREDFKNNSSAISSAAISIAQLTPESPA